MNAEEVEHKKKTTERYSNNQESPARPKTTSKKACPKHAPHNRSIIKQDTLDNSSRSLPPPQPPQRPDPPKLACSTTPTNRRSHHSQCKKLTRSHSTSSKKMSEPVVLSTATSSSASSERPCSSAPGHHEATNCYSHSNKGNSHTINSTSSHPTYSNHTGGSITHSGNKKNCTLKSSYFLPLL